MERVAERNHETLWRSETIERVARANHERGHAVKGLGIRKGTGRNALACLPVRPNTRVDRGAHGELVMAVR